RSRDSGKQGFIEEKGDVDNPFEEIGTRPPPVSEGETFPSGRRRLKHYKSADDYYRNMYQEYYQQRHHAQNGLLYRVYPGLHPKDSTYCPNMRGMFAFTCQPSKPLRLDLVEFCKIATSMQSILQDYSAFCGVPNFHRLPGPRMGPPITSDSSVSSSFTLKNYLFMVTSMIQIGHVGVSGKFGFGVGAVPGLDVGVGWGVDVGPIPGMGESVGVDLGLDVGVVGAKSPVAYRRGMDNPNEKGGGVFGISGGVGVKAPGAGNIGVGSGIGVGK
ncbi:hypothetical protein ANCCEY_07693, partial [Ancylostoma ceylanicum]